MIGSSPESSLKTPSRLIERRLAEFVDRDAEMGQFRAVLDAQDRPVMVVFGGTGMGKTSLLLRMVHECALRQLQKAEVVWNDTSPHDYMAVMRKLRDDLGVQHFTSFTDLINYYTDAAYHPKLEITLNMAGQTSIEVASRMKMENATARDIAAVIIRDNMFVVPRADLATPEAARREQLTLRFLQGLRLAAQGAPVVVFFDAVEKMSSDTHAWLWEQLLNSVRIGQFDNVKFVLCGQKPPPEDRDWEIYIESAELKPLGVEDVAAYLGKRAPALPQDARAEVATLLHAITKGRPTDVAASVDLYLKSRKT